MPAREASWNEVFDRVLDARLRSVHTALPGTIRSHSEAEQTVTVELAVQLEGPGGSFEAAPNLEGVPVSCPGAWSNGDRCLVVFCEESFAKWFETGSVEPPDVLQRHGLHAIAIPLVARAGDDVQFVALANLVTTQLTMLKTAIDSAAGTESGAGGLGGMTALKAALDIAPNLPPGWPGPVASTKVKAR